MILQYESKMKTLQESIDRLEKENELLKLNSLQYQETSRSTPTSERKIYQPVEDNINSLQKRTPPSSARRRLQSSNHQYGSDATNNNSSNNNGVLESPRIVIRTPPRYPQRYPPGSAHEGRRHSSYTTGDYIVSYDMRESIDDNPLNTVQEESETPLEKLATNLLQQKQLNFKQTQSQPQPQFPQQQKQLSQQQKSQNNTNNKIGIDFIPGVELATHPYYPHSPAASILWQESVVQQVNLIN